MRMSLYLEKKARKNKGYLRWLIKEQKESETN